MPRLALAVLVLETLQIREVGRVDEIHQGPQLFLDVLHRGARHEHAVLVRVDSRADVHHLSRGVWGGGEALAQQSIIL